MRQAGEDEIIEALYEADAEMVANGIVAVGDISNTDHSFSVKGNSKIHYHTFPDFNGSCRINRSSCTVYCFA